MYVLYMCHHSTTERILLLDVISVLTSTDYESYHRSILEFNEKRSECGITGRRATTLHQEGKGITFDVNEGQDTSTYRRPESESRLPAPAL